MLVSDAIYQVRGLYLKAYSDDFRPGNRFIYQKIKSARALILSQQNDKGNLYNSSEYQTIKCFPFNIVDISECCNVKLGKKISKSKFKLPKSINFNSGRPAVDIYTIDYGNKINIQGLDSIISNITKKYQFPIPDAFIQNEYLYLNETITGVKLQGIFEDPEIIDDLNVCFEYDNCGNLIQETCPIPMLEKSFNISGKLWDNIALKAALDIARFYGISVEDKSNDANNNSAGGNPKIR